VEDLVDAAVGVDADDVAPRRAVVLDERRGLALVELEPPPDRVGRVVGATLLGCPAEHPSDQLVALRHLEVEDDVEGPPELAQKIVERLGLGHRAREAVEDKAADRVATRQPVADQFDHLLVGDEVAPVVDLTQLLAQRRVARHHVPDHVAGGDVGNPVHRLDPLRLRALAGALRPQHEDVQRKNPS
jgi:hypothetical protein